MRCPCGDNYKVAEEHSGGYVWFKLTCDRCGRHGGYGVPDDSYFVDTMGDYLKAEGAL